MTWSDDIFDEFRHGRIDSFYTHIYPDMLVYATSLLKGDLALRAEDCVQDAVEASYVRRNQFATSGEWKAFIITCVRNKAISIKRHSVAQANYISSLELDPEPTVDALHDYIEVETRMRLYNAISTLPEQLRQVFNLSFEEGLRNPEIARRLGVAEITVKKRKARLIENLRRLLGNDADLLLILYLIG